LSQSIAGGSVLHFGYHAGFLFLSGVAAFALLLLWIAMPETLDIAKNPHQKLHGWHRHFDAHAAVDTQVLAGDEPSFVESRPALSPHSLCAMEGGPTTRPAAS